MMGKKNLSSFHHHSSNTHAVMYFNRMNHNFFYFFFTLCAIHVLFFSALTSDPLQVQCSFRMNIKSSEEVNIDLEDIHSSGKTDLGTITKIYFFNR